MKRLVHIAARILIAYFIALPILFVCHTIQHGHDCDDDRVDGLEYAQFTPDCTLCDLYHNQSSTVETSHFYLGALTLVSLLVPFTGSLTEVSEGFIFLRGPPIV